MTARFSSVLLACCLAVALPASAPGDDKPIHIKDAWARKAGMMAHGAGATPPAGSGHAGGSTPATPSAHGNGAVYATITNTGKTADALIAASSDVAERAELHRTVDEGGVMKMRPQARIDVPASGAVEMKPGSYHVMLMGLKRDLVPGQTVAVTLTFEKAGRVVVEAPIR
jgi:copper(I)-binding protein